MQAYNGANPVDFCILHLVFYGLNLFLFVFLPNLASPVEKIPQLADWAAA